MRGGDADASSCGLHCPEGLKIKTSMKIAVCIIVVSTNRYVCSGKIDGKGRALCSLNAFVVTHTDQN